ncbi:MAG TPA: multicopper oxidase family protein [Xanthobacteraceae bacterium]|nr:multicopper oxidase family protein [Xanthobacteraceae bacterium]
MTSHPDFPLPALSRRALLAGIAAGPLLAALPRAAAAADPRALTAVPGSARLLGPEAPATELFTYDGALPGPVLRVKAGEELALAFANKLPEPTSLCWGGLAVPNGLAGVPGLAGAAVAPGAGADIRFTPRDAGTYLFGPFETAQAGRGLAGVLVVEDTAPPSCDRDFVLLVQDWRVAPDQRVHLTTNGEPAPRLVARAGERVRLRFVNATRGLFLPLRLDDHPSWIIAIDGRPSEPFPPSQGRLLLAPGGRVDLLVDLVRDPEASLPIVVETEDGDVPLASIAYAAQPPLRAAPLPAPTPLPGGDGIVALGQATRVTLEFADTPATTFAAEPLARVAGGRTVVASITNRSSLAASIHLYGHAARLLDALDDGWKPWWHDSIGLAPGRTTRLAFIAGAPGRWPIVARRGGDDVPLALAWFEALPG